MATRDTTRYQLKGIGGKILHRGQTGRALGERHSEHKEQYGEDTRIAKVDPKVPKKTALRWERDGGKRI